MVGPLEESLKDVKVPLVHIHISLLRRHAREKAQTNFDLQCKTKPLTNTVALVQLSGAPWVGPLPTTKKETHEQLASGRSTLPLETSGLKKGVMGILIPANKKNKSRVEIQKPSRDSVPWYMTGCTGGVNKNLMDPLVHDLLK